MPEEPTPAADDLFIGVDGGGTGCRARIRDAAGRLLGEGTGGPANARLGDVAWNSVLGACRAAAAAAGLDPDDLGRMHAGLGLAGAAQAADRAAVLARPHPFASVTLDTDSYVAWLGAQGGADGGVLIVGTGSGGLAVVGGRRFGIGGWGAEISDDGGGAAIGREALRRAVWAFERLAPPSPLASALMHRFDGDPEAVIAWAGRARPADYAGLAPLVLEHGGRGDPLAVVLLGAAGDHLGRMIGRLIDFGAPVLTLVGGLAEPMRPWLPAALSPVLVRAAADPLDGAILMARRALAERQPDRAAEAS